MEAKREKIILAAAAILFFVAYSWFGIVSPKIFNSPDETANYFFITQFSKNGDFFSPALLNYFLSGALHPRSISWNGYTLVSQGFIGLPLIYGWLAKIFGLWAVKFFTPLLAIFGALSFYGIVKKIFGARTAAISLILLLFSPSYWYYSSRFLYPNVPFAALLIIAAWAAINGALYRGNKKRYLIIFSVGFPAALALRPVEGLWVLPLAILSFIFYRKNFSWHKLFYALLIMGFIAVPILAANLFLYGNIFGSGYTLERAVDFGPALAAAPASCRTCVIFPFGFNVHAILKNINLIFIKYLWWFSAAAVLGFLFCFFKKKKKEVGAYLAFAALLSVWLIIYYGSGNFTDNPNGIVTMGDSHFRYWLPVFIVMIPLAGFMVEKIIFRVRPLYRNVFFFGGFVFLTIMSVQAIFFSLDDGLLSVNNNLRNNYEIKSEVLRLVGPEDIIITGRQDKIFFPDRQVFYAQKIADPFLFFNLQKLKNTNFYFYGIGPSAEEFYTMGNIARVYGFRFKRVAIFGKEALYQLEKLNQSFAYLK